MIRKLPIQTFEDYKRNMEKEYDNLLILLILLILVALCETNFLEQIDINAWQRISFASTIWLLNYFLFIKEFLVHGETFISIATYTTNLRGMSIWSKSMLAVVLDRWNSEIIQIMRATLSGRWWGDPPAVEY